VKRDFDLIRLILLDLEQSSIPVTQKFYYHFAHDDRDAVANAIVLMLDKKLIEAEYRPTLSRHPSDSFGKVRMTWDGHDFLNTVRDDEIWRKAKEGVDAAGVFSFDLLKKLASGLVRTQIEKHTGIKIDD
jgi:hypothetical protein